MNVTDDRPRNSLDDLRRLVNGRRVVVVGNASSIIGQGRGKEIESYDVVARFNQGYPWVHPADLGTRTDIYVSCGDVPIRFMDRLNPRWFMTSNERPNNAQFEPFTYPEEWKCELEAALDGERPTSGIRLLDLLSRETRPACVHLIGFDFLRTPSWHGRLSEAHSGLDEEGYVRRHLPYVKAL